MMKPLLSGRSIVSSPLHPQSLPIAQDAAAYPGARVLGADGRVYESTRYPTSESPYTWRSVVEIAEDVAANVFRVISEPITLTVGAGGDYPSLGEALTFLSNFTPAAAVDYPLATITILDDTTLAEQIELRGVNMNWVDITQESNSDVPVDVSGFEVDSGRYAFLSLVGAIGPVLRCHFVRTGENVPALSVLNGVHGLVVATGSTANVLADDDDSETPVPAGFSGFDVNSLVSFGGTGNFSAALFDDATFFGLDIRGTCSAFSCMVRGSGSSGARVSGLLRIGATLTYPDIGSNLRKTEGANDPADVVVSNGGEISINSANVLGGFNQAINLRTVDGYINQTGPVVAYKGLILPQPYTVATVPSAAANIGGLIFVSDGAAGAAVLAFSDGTNWLRSDTRAAIASS